MIRRFTLERSMGLIFTTESTALTKKEIKLKLMLS